MMSLGWVLLFVLLWSGRGWPSNASSYRTRNNPFARRQLSSTMAVSTLAGNGAASFGSVVTVAGNLEPGYVDAVGIHPYHVAMHPSGNFLIIATVKSAGWPPILNRFKRPLVAVVALAMMALAQLLH